MPFDTFTSRLKKVAVVSLAFCRSRYGANGLKVEENIDNVIGWQPTFFLRPTRFLILAVEVNDLVYPEALKAAAHDIGHFDTPIAVFQACPLDAFQNDPKHTKVNLLRKHGFGIITVDDDNAATIQHPCIPLAQHISPEELEHELAGLNSVLKVKFKAAHQTYTSNIGQGLQEVGQLIEALLHSVAKQAAKNGIIAAINPAHSLAARCAWWRKRFCQGVQEHRESRAEERTAGDGEDQEVQDRLLGRNQRREKAALHDASPRIHHSYLYYVIRQLGGV
jgi:hypothetical protein